MYFARKANKTYVYDVYFTLVVVCGTYFVLNLMVAVQSGYFGEAF